MKKIFFYIIPLSLVLTLAGYSLYYHPKQLIRLLKPITHFLIPSSNSDVAKKKEQYTRMATTIFTHPWPKEAFFNNNRLLYLFSKNNSLFSSERIVGKVTDSQDDIKLTCDLLISIHNSSISDKQRLITTGEILTKVLAYRSLKPNDIIPIPTVSYSGKPTLTYYVVSKVFDLWNGFPAFGLVDKNKKSPPILLFRGTDFSLNTKQGWASIVSDLDPKSVGFHLFKKSNTEIEAWLQEQTTRTLKARVMGFSLGANLAAYTILYANEYIAENRFSPSFAFNPPGFSKKMYQQWEKVQNPSYFWIFINPNDPISKVGILFGNIYKLQLLREKTPVLEAHTKLMTAQKEFLISHVKRKYLFSKNPKQ